MSPPTTYDFIPEYPDLTLAITWISTTSLILVNGASRINASTIDPENKEGKTHSVLHMLL